MNELLFTLTPTDGTPVVLTHAVDGWDEAFIVTERSRKYHGIFRSWTVALRFVKDGAALLREEFYTYGMKASCTFTVSKLDRQTLDYFTAFTGRIDFSTFRDGDNQVEVTVLDGGLAQIVKTMEGEEVMFNANAFDTEYGSINARVVNVIDGAVYHNAYCLPVIQVFNAVLDEITGGGVTAGTYAVKSNFFSSTAIYNRYFLTAIGLLKYCDRSKTLSNYQTSLADLFKSMDAIFCLGLGIEIISGKETLVIEPREYFYNGETIKDIGNSSTLSAGYVQEFHFSKIKAGYPNVEYGEDANVGNGTANVAEPNTETTFLVRNDAAKNEYDIVSKYRADSVGFELLWNSETEDTADTELAIVCLFYYTYEETPGNFVSVWTHTFGALAKSTDPGVDYSYPWNMEISPKRNLQRHQRFMNGCCFGLSGENLTLLNVTNDQSYNETAVLASATATERDWLQEYGPVAINDDNTWFRPIEFVIEAAYPREMINLINDNPYGVIEFTYKRNTYKGYILKMETRLAGAGSVKYSLLSTADNDLTKLIR